MTSPSPLLQIEGLSVATRRGRSILDDVAFTLGRSETLGIVGESGCGKSTLALAITGLLPDNLRASGSIRFDSRELQGLPERRLRAFRGTRIAMIFQNPFTSLNPAVRVGDQIAEMLEVHRGLSRADARQRAVKLLEQVEIPRAAERMLLYPHEFSGGMQQRAMIAIAISCAPELLIADEPTTALDVTVQAQILQLLRRLADEQQMSLILVSHDLAVIGQLAETVAVMYAGRIVEHAPAAALFNDAQHPYTRALLSAVPSIDDQERGPLPTIPGSVESGRESPACRFAPRCDFAIEICRQQAPPLECASGVAGLAACWVRPWGRISPAKPAAGDRP
jgi:oligopeptide/dipeptide ABC transporter ATP-binding protein